MVFTLKFNNGVYTVVFGFATVSIDLKSIEQDASSILDFISSVIPEEFEDYKDMLRDKNIISKYLPLITRAVSCIEGCNSEYSLRFTPEGNIELFDIKMEGGTLYMKELMLVISEFQELEKEKIDKSRAETKRILDQFDLNSEEEEFTDIHIKRGSNYNDLLIILDEHELLTGRISDLLSDCDITTRVSQARLNHLNLAIQEEQFKISFEDSDDNEEEIIKSLRGQINLDETEERMYSLQSDEVYPAGTDDVAPKRKKLIFSDTPSKGDFLYHLKCNGIIDEQSMHSRLGALGLRRHNNITSDFYEEFNVEVIIGDDSNM